MLFLESKLKSLFSSNHIFNLFSLLIFPPTVWVLLSLSTLFISSHLFLSLQEIRDLPAHFCAGKCFYLYKKKKKSQLLYHVAGSIYQHMSIFV